MLTPLFSWSTYDLNPRQDSLHADTHRLPHALTWRRSVQEFNSYPSAWQVDLVMHKYFVDITAETYNKMMKVSQFNKELQNMGVEELAINKKSICF